MKHKHSTNAWTDVQKRATKLCIEEGAINWQNRTFCDVAFQQFPLDFRSKEGRMFRNKCKHVSNTSQLKQFTISLAKLDVSSGGTCVSPPVVQCDHCPEHLLLRIHRCVSRWWMGHNRRQKGCAYAFPSQWKNDVDPISQESMHTIPTQFVFTYVDSHRCAYAFDIRTLNVLFTNQMMSNPFNKELFPSSIIQSTKHRILRLTKLGYGVSMADEKASAFTKLSLKKQNQARALEIIHALSDLGYHVTVEMLNSLTPHQQIKWYRSCEDIWNHRAELTNANRARIAPGADVFPMKSTIKSYVNRKTALFKHVLEAMQRLIMTGITDGDRGIGSMYVITALTDCDSVFKEAFPWLVQPP
jgi:hypothetical protein